MFLKSKIAKVLMPIFLVSACAIFLAKGASPVFAAPFGLVATPGCFADAGFIKFEWSDTDIGSYHLDVRVAGVGASWPDATHPGQNVGVVNFYTWGGLFGITNIGIGPSSYESGGFTPGTTYEWRLWNGVAHTPPSSPSVVAPTCAPASPPPGDFINFTLALLNSDGCDFVFSIANEDGTPGAGHGSTLGVVEAGYVSPVIPDGITSVTYTARTKEGPDEAVLLLYTVEISNRVTFTVPGGCKTWKDPGPPPPPFDIMDVFQPAKRFGSFGQLASDVLLILVSLAGALALIFIMVSGFKFVTSSGDEKKLASARATLTYAIIGIAVVILAFVIVQILQYFLQSSIPIT